MDEDKRTSFIPDDDHTPNQDDPDVIANNTISRKKHPRQKRVSLDAYGDGEQHELPTPLPPYDEYGMYLSTLSPEDLWIRKEEAQQRRARVRGFLSELKERLTKNQRIILYTTLRLGYIDVVMLQKAIGRSRRTVYYEIEAIKRVAHELSENYPDLAYVTFVWPSN